MKRKQIEKAAESYTQEIINSNTFDVNYEEDNYDAGSFHVTSKVCPMAFKDGASWRINSVWHGVEKEPKRGVWLLVQIGDDDFDTTIMEEDNWEKLRIVMNIKRWAYVSDLMPDGKEDKV